MKKHDKNACTVDYINETELIEAAVEVLGTDENYEMKFYCEMEKAVVFGTKIEFYFMEGSVKVWQRR